MKKRLILLIILIFLFSLVNIGFSEDTPTSDFVRIPEQQSTSTKLRPVSNGIPIVEPVILDEYTHTNIETGVSYTVTKRIVDGKKSIISVNQKTGRTEEGKDQIKRDYEDYLKSLPKPYQKMSRNLRLKIKEKYDTLPLPDEITKEESFPVIFIANDTSQLNEIIDVVKNLTQDYRDWDGQTIKFVSAELHMSSLLELTDKNFVNTVWYNEKFHLSIDDSVPSIGTNQVHQDGTTGCNANVGVIDTGVDNSHPNLNNVINRADFTGSGTNDDINGHGTHVAGIIGSNHTNFRGMAHCSGILSAKVIGGPNSNTDIIIQGIDWALTQGADIITMSINSYLVSTDGTSELTKYLDYVVYHEYTPFFVSVGNFNDTYNPDTEILVPADAYNTISVGATNLNFDDVAWFSGHGFTDDGRMKVDVVAPGTSIDSANNNWETQNDFIPLSGTSMATPHVAGLAALLYDWRDRHILWVDTPSLKSTILTSADKLNGWTHSNTNPLDENQGAGQINSLEAYNLYKNINKVHYRNVYDEDSRYYLIHVTDAPNIISLTLVWNRHVTDYTVYPPNINDLDLYLHDGGMSNLARSYSTRNNVEHIYFEAPSNGYYWVEVDPYDISTDNTEYYVLTSNYEMQGYDKDYCIDNDDDLYFAYHATRCPEGDDCDDSNPDINPGSIEECDGIDNNCDDIIDPGCTCTDGQTRQCGTTDVGECQYGTQTCSGGTWGSCVGNIDPVPEGCPHDGKDNDCDGQIDENYCGGFECYDWSVIPGGEWRDHIQRVRYGPYCADGRNWRNIDIDSDGYAEKYMLVGEMYRVWADCIAETYLYLDNYVSDFTNYDQTVSYGCYDGVCNDWIERTTWSQTYSSVSSTINYPDMYCIDRYGWGWGWSGGTLWWYWDTNSNGQWDPGEHQEYGMVVNCGVDSDCAWDEYCYKPTPSNPTTYYCSDKCGNGVCDPGENCPQDGTGPESCNNVDDDCDGQIDENLYQQCGTTDIGECQYGTQICSGGAWGSCVGNIDPVPEICDGLDNDCDGTTDDNLTPPQCELTQGVCSGTTKTCGGTAGWISCKPSDYGPNYEEIEVSCDNLDNDCNGTTDGISQSCGSGNCNGTQFCTAGVWNDCSSSGNDCGTCCICDSGGNETYDETQNVDCGNSLYCDGQETCQALFTCQNGILIDCSDDLFCTVNESCDEEIDACVYDNRDCSVNDIIGVATCDWIPDDYHYTWDFRGAFTSVCDENLDICPTGDETIDHTCDITTCGAECEVNEDCPSGTCQTDCTCVQDTTPPQWRNQGQNNSKPLQGEAIELYAEGFDDYGLGYAWLATNETGEWEIKNSLVLNELNDSSTAKTLTFNTNENKTLWMKLPKGVDVVDTKLNLSGFWDSEIVDESVTVDGSSSIFLNEDDIHISYYDSDNDDLKYAKYNGTWTIQTIQEGGDVGGTSFIGITNDNHIHIVYTNYTPPISIYHTEWDGTDWINRSVVLGTNSQKYVNSMGPNGMIVDGNKLHVIYRAINVGSCAGEGVGYAEWNATDWILMGVDGDSCDCGGMDFGDIAQTSDGNISFLYRDLNQDYAASCPGGTNDLKYKYWNGTHFSSKTIIDNGPSDKVSMVNIFNTLHVFYEQSNLLKYARYNETDWSVDNVIESINPSYITVVSTSNQLFVGYNDHTNGKLKCAKNESSSWTIQLLEPISVSGSSLAIDSNNMLFMSYIYNNKLYLGKSNYPENPYLDVGEDGDIEWSHSGKFNIVERTLDFSSEINDYLSTCISDENGYCDVPLILHSDTAGKIQTSNINIVYNRYQNSLIDLNNTANEWIWSNFTWQNSSIPGGTTVTWKIYYNDTSGNENVTDVMTFTILPDNDGDSISDDLDNCPYDYNPDQLDSDNQNGGDICDECPADSTDTCNTEETGSEIINETGGTVNNSIGTAEVEISPNAIAEPTTISITQNSNINTGFVIKNDTQTVSNAFVFTPENFTFNEPVNITLTYNESLVMDESNLDIYWYNETSDEWIPMNADCNLDLDYCTIQVTHFSEYVIAELIIINPPIIIIHSPTPKNYSVGTVWFNVSADIAVDTWEYELNGGGRIGFTPNITINVAQCSNDLTVYATASGQEGSSSVSFNTLTGDVDGDLDVDIFDIVLCAGAYGSLPGQPKWKQQCDINPQPDGDGQIDIFDIVMMAGNYGKKC